jgi:hypothetical protein
MENRKSLLIIKAEIHVIIFKELYCKYWKQDLRELLNVLNEVHKGEMYVELVEVK